MYKKSQLYLRDNNAVIHSSVSEGGSVGCHGDYTVCWRTAFNYICSTFLTFHVEVWSWPWIQRFDKPANSSRSFHSSFLELSSADVRHLIWLNARNLINLILYCTFFISIIIHHIFIYVFFLFISFLSLINSLEMKWLRETEEVRWHATSVSSQTQT